MTVPESYGLVKLEVYDYDTFSADDIMGEAELDIQPLDQASECRVWRIRAEWLPLDQ
ncbi:hypothetical protein F2Q68_00045433 [Brassica cretica]|uniref:C2 domain-containing protein n=1 Tax=Brassica cretica TaxID=69181 RepID=A0A8S9LLL4_BRACR|nr:hypothetical protein F2Q68_00045433 [Brassica cretica]